MAGTSATLLARKWESALLVNVDNETLKRILANERAMEAVMNIEGFRALGDTCHRDGDQQEREGEGGEEEGGRGRTKKVPREISEEEKEYKSKRKADPREADQIRDPYTRRSCI
jgi:hypothetical protein